MADYEIDEIRRIRREISARFNHDASKLGEYYRKLEEKYRKSGKYKFVDPPPEKPKAARSEDKEAAGRLTNTRLSEIENLPDDNIDTSDIPELDDEFWENAKRIVPENYIPIEHEVLEWFKGQGKDYHDQINMVLRAYMESHR